MPNISIARLRELEAAEQQLDEIQKQKQFSWIGVELGQALATCLAVKPWRDWTPTESGMLQYVCRNSTDAYWFYLSRLPD